uniref:Reverse transcriptase Ty1/copia-type domain-containing protein n=1 Tax=Physcomitrium patens TaxID=3218 RepID=A0A2K1L8K2_PHYPA|nr:hypothetical protein PHYPA_000790 [Physcomitrium patens]
MTQPTFEDVIDKFFIETHCMVRLPKKFYIDDKNPTPLLCDNVSSMRLVRNLIMHQRTKHIELNHHYIKIEQSK